MNKWKFKKYRIWHSSVTKISILVRRCFDHLAFPGSSRFAYAHQFTQTWWEKSQTAKRTHKTSRSMKNLPWKSPKCHLIWKLKLAPPRPRITLRAGRNKLYESISIKTAQAVSSGMLQSIGLCPRFAEILPIQRKISYRLSFSIISLFWDSFSFSSVKIEIRNSTTNLEHPAEESGRKGCGALFNQNLKLKAQGQSSRLDGQS